MAAATKYALAATASTGNNTHTAVTPVSKTGAAIAAQLVVEVAGGTPTVTWKVQGSLDGGLNWYDCLYVTDSSDTAAATALTSTAVGAKVIFLDNRPSRAYTSYRLVTSSNTNITYRGELYEVDSASL